MEGNCRDTRKVGMAEYKAFWSEWKAIEAPKWPENA